MDATLGISIRWIQGFTNKSITFVDSKTLCYTCGNHICFLNLETKKQSVLQSPGRGAGVLTANGNNGIFAFSERKLLPSIFVYNFPELQMQNELKGGAQLEYKSLTLSNGGPYLGSFSSLPDHTITVWNWETTEPICTKPNAGYDVISLVFNPLDWLQLCALGTTSLTVWNIEKSDTFHVLKPSVIELPATDGSFINGSVKTSNTDSNTQNYFGPEMPPSAISGLKGDKAEQVVNKLCIKARLTPTAVCWTNTSEIYVGCEEGFLLLVDSETLSVSVSFNPKDADAIPELRQSNFQGLAFNKNGLVTVGKESLVHCLQIRGTQMDITQTWQLEGPVTRVMYSPDYETLLSSSNTGQIYILNPAPSDVSVKFLDVLCGNFVAAALSHTDKNICVSLRDSGELQLWSTDGVLISSMSFQTEVTSLACCPIANYAAVGTSSGSVLFIDLNREQQPRLVHQVHLYHTPVDHLVFDQEGHYLLTGASDCHIYVLDAKPSNMFSCIGYTVVPGSVLSLSTQCIRDCEKVIVLALCTGQEDRDHDGRLLAVLSLPVKDLAGPDCIDTQGCLWMHILQMSRFQVPDPLQSCVLGINEVLAYCHKKKTIQRFQLPQDADGVSSEQVVQLIPYQEVTGHLLGPASLILSPHQLWLASVGRDGLLRIRETDFMERFIELPCHSYRDGGIRRVSFSADSRTILTTGFQDGSLVCSHLRVKGVDDGKMKEATQYSQSMDHSLRSIFNRENPVLVDRPSLIEGSPAATEKPEGSEVSPGADTVGVTEQEESYDVLLSALPSHPTWFQSRQDAVMQEEKYLYSARKENLRKAIEELRNTIKEMICENENIPDIERLELQEFNLDVEEQRRLEAVVEQEVSQVKNEIKLKILEKCYLRDVLKMDCWDSLKVKSRAIKAFNSELEVMNFPMNERTEKEVELLRRVENMRMHEKTSVLRSSDASSEMEEELDDESPMAERSTITGSISAQLECTNPYLYDQFNLKSSEQCINQIILLQDVIHRIKTAFNADFETLHRQKMQEVNRVRERNRNIMKIMLELDMNKKLWEPIWAICEQPERLLTVDDSEIKSEKYLTPEQKNEEEERRRLEEEGLLAAKANNFRERALDDMMDGALEAKKECILKVEILVPEFVLNKPENQWSDEEKRIHKEYERDTENLHEEKELYKKSLGSEISKLKVTTKDATERFDENLRKLFEKKLNCGMAIYQEELKITYLFYAVQIEEEMKNRELELKLKHEKTIKQMDEISEEVKKHEERVQFCHDTYERVVAEDKVLNKEFKKEFVDVPNHIVDQLYKSFKRRPRVQKIRTLSDISPSLSRDQPLCGSSAPDGLGKMLKAMEELDAPENKPEGLNPSIWERFCLVRRTKVESEHKMKVKTLTLAEMQAFLQNRKHEEQTAQLEISNLADELESLHKEKNRFLTDIMVQVLLKQDQVELSTTDMTADYSHSVLLHRNVVENLNRTIRTLGVQKIASMEKHKNFRKGIIQLQWEHKKMNMQVDDLYNKTRDIKMLHLSELQQDYLNKTEGDSVGSKQAPILEKTIALKEKCHKKNVQHRIKNIEHLNKQAAKKTKQNASLKQQLQDLELTVAKMRNIYKATASGESQATKREVRFQEIMKRRKFRDLSKAQAAELAFLREEVLRLRMKNFPSLPQLNEKTSEECQAD